ncbi:MAG: PH domain-containing protein [Planctomycetaceae bacterium]|nr:PH domain-containing protein [Planctomycetaceae bacterium]
MSAENTILKAEFNPKVCVYWLLSGALVFIMTIVGIPLLILWFPLGFVFTKRYLDRMECVLTDKALKVRKGIFVRVEKTIPLEKITDMGMVQGPIMRSFDLHTLTVETAGQSGVGSLVSLTGIVNAPEFRETVLSQRERQAGHKSQVSPLQSIDEQELSDGNSLLTEIRDSLVRIESILEKPSER